MTNCMLNKMSSGSSLDFSISDCSSETSVSSNDLCELLPLEKLKSTVWEYSGFPTENGKFPEKDNKLIL